MAVFRCVVAVVWCVSNMTMKPAWFEDSWNLEEALDNMFNMPGMQHMGKVKSFLTCKKSAKMRLCMNQDTKKKIETNFGPVEELLQSLFFVKL